VTEVRIALDSATGESLLAFPSRRPAAEARFVLVDNQTHKFLGADGWDQAQRILSADYDPEAPFLTLRLAGSTTDLVKPGTNLTLHDIANGIEIPFRWPRSAEAPTEPPAITTPKVVAPVSSRTSAIIGLIGVALFAAGLGAGLLLPQSRSDGPAAAALKPVVQVSGTDAGLADREAKVAAEEKSLAAAKAAFAQQQATAAAGAVHAESEDAARGDDITKRQEAVTAGENQLAAERKALESDRAALKDAKAAFAQQQAAATPVAAPAESEDAARGDDVAKRQAALTAAENQLAADRKAFEDERVASKSSQATSPAADPSDSEEALRTQIKIFGDKISAAKVENDNLARKYADEQALSNTLTDRKRDADKHLAEVQSTLATVTQQLTLSAAQRDDLARQLADVRNKLAAVPAIQPTRAVWAAVAISPNESLYTTGNQVEEKAAIDAAIAMCRYKGKTDHCELVRTFRDECLSLARDGRNEWSIATGDWDASREQAQSGCTEKYGGQCRVIYTVCSPDTLSKID